MSFDVSLCAKYVEQLLQYDEVERALLVLDNVPAEFRDNVPPALANLKADIISKLYTPHTYTHCLSDAKIDIEKTDAMLQYLSRGQIVIAQVKAFNDAGQIPHIVELGAGTYFVPHGLARLGYRFTYEDISLNIPAAQAAGVVRRPRESMDQPVLFLAMEVIEHLPEPRDIATDCLKHSCKWPEAVILSTPKYTFDSTSHVEWRTNVEGLPHLRAYTPSEFYLEAMRLFPRYNWHLDPSQVMTLHGIRNH